MKNLLFALAAAALLSNAALADSKLILLDDNIPRNLSLFELSADEDTLYFGGSGEFLGLDQQANFVRRIPGANATKELIQRPDGWFFAFNSHAGGHIALYRPDGTEAKKIVGRGGGRNTLKPDMTGWTSPTGGAVDFKNKLIFALDLSMPPRGKPSPYWSRIAIFGYDGKFVGDINFYDGSKEDADDAARTWYNDVEVDPERKRVYASSVRYKKTLIFDYEGKKLGELNGDAGIAVFPDGRVATSSGSNIFIYDTDFNQIKTINANLGVSDMEAGSDGSLYLSASNTPTVAFKKYAPNLETAEEFGPPYKRIDVAFGSRSGIAGRLYEIEAVVSGRPEPENPDNWQVLARPSDGSDLEWRKLEAAYREKKLFVEIPESYRGLYEVAVKWGNGPIAWADRQSDLYVQQTFSFLPEGASKSLAAITSSGRRAYVAGEAIDVQIIRRQKEADLDVPVTVQLAKDGTIVARLANVESTGNDAFIIPGSYTSRLVPGEYALKAVADGYESYALDISIVQAEEKSPMQRALYHEFGGSAMEAAGFADAAEYKDFARNYARTVNRMGFTRETNRMVGKTGSNGPNGWKMTGAGADISDPGFAPSEYFRSPDSTWFSEYYHDLAARYGIRIDSQLIGHCGSVMVAESEFDEYLPLLQRYAQWLDTYPSFYGFNYNDELFYGAWNPNWQDPQKEAMRKIREEILPAQLKAKGEDRKPLEAEVRLYALEQMYDRFNKAVRLADPDANLTATPMWQYPACEGSYAPTIYDTMSETYSHYLSEGYQFPWYPAHSLEFLKRPGLPSVAVFDNGYGGGWGDVYLKSSMQMLGRGTQAVGVEHTAPFDDYRAVDAFRTANKLAEVYGPVFANVQPDNAGSILYSITQDLTERRHHFGSPHWERGFGLMGAGLMCGVPMDIVYEEDLRAGLLLENGKPRTPMLFLLGVTVQLPDDVRDAIAAYQNAGGRVFIDTASADFPGAQQLGFDSFAIKEVMGRAFDADTVIPEWAPVMEDLAQKLSAAVKEYVPYPVSTDDLWVGKNLFDGGDARYVMLSTEMSPYPWDAGEVWALGLMYGKGDYHWRPKTTTLSLPADQSTIYDVFAKKIVNPQIADGTAQVEVDLTLLPGRLYACVPAPLGVPELRTAQQGNKVYYQAQVVTEAGLPIKAEVPVRVRLASANETAAELYRITKRDGSLSGELDVPVTGGGWSIEVAELLGGKASAAAVSSDADAVAAFMRTAPAAEVYRKERIQTLLQLAREQGGISLHMRDNVLSETLVGAIRSALEQRNVTLKIADQLPNEPTQGVYIAADFLSGDAPGETLLRQAWYRGIFDIKPTRNIPGKNRGIVTALIAPRGYQEHAIALLGGDADGLTQAADAFVKYLLNPAEQIEEPGPIPAYDTTGKPTEAAPLPQLDEMVGVRLADVAVSADGGRIVVSADTFHKNVALLAENGASARVLKTERIADSVKSRDLFISRDGSQFGLTARVANSYGLGFHLLDAASESVDAFGAYGDTERYFRRFGVASDGNTVVAGGRYGVVCWKRTGDGWRQAWSIDYWKQFDNLEWPVTASGERIPQFHAVVPDGANYALVLFGEFSANGWISDKDQGDVWLAALSLQDGTELWRFDVPIADKRLLPELHTSPDGSRVILEVDVSKSPRKFYCLNNGKLLGSYQTGVQPITVQISNDTGWCAAAYKGRLLEIRDAAGNLVYNRLWPSQPFSLAFAENGKALIVSDDASKLTRIAMDGTKAWSIDLPVTAHVNAWKDRVYAACWDGRLRSFDADGSPRWTVNLTPELIEKNAMARLAEKQTNINVHTVARESNASNTVPAGQNLLATNKASLKIGGTPGWKSGGRVQVKAEQLTNSEINDVDTPWLSIPEVFWTSTAGRQVWAEITFTEPTDVSSLTVYENPDHPESYPEDSVIQVWNEETQHWDTAKFGIFLDGPVNTYSLNLKNVEKLRYLPWSSYFTNFYTSEIEVR